MNGREGHSGGIFDTQQRRLGGPSTSRASLNIFNLWWGEAGWLDIIFGADDDDRLYTVHETLIQSTMETFTPSSLRTSSP